MRMAGRFWRNERKGIDSGGVRQGSTNMPCFRGARSPLRLIARAILDAGEQEIRRLRASIGRSKPVSS